MANIINKHGLSAQEQRDFIIMIVLIFHGAGGVDAPYRKNITLSGDSDYQNDMNYRYNVNR
ncbi:hypothetical protein [Pseudescherichia vulneris]|uniref:hypothetical protein n=1 Tax=Pseudescherichia vulneris TaxID=566 RepID=UPI0028D784DE|nr:hypothetical protein [Pseudescherichia vulneris]